jgi:epoxide hydrolase
MRELVEHWRHGFDWRPQEARLNAFPQYKVRLDDIDLHFIHAKGILLKRCPNLLTESLLSLL